MLGLRHWVATVPEDEDGEAGCRGTALAAGGERGEEGRLPWPCPWPWPWELVRWKRHLKDPAWVAGAQTHLEAARSQRRTAPTPTRATSSVYSWICGWLIYMKLIPSDVVANTVHIIHIVMH